MEESVWRVWMVLEGVWRVLKGVEGLEGFGGFWRVLERLRAGKRQL